MTTYIHQLPNWPHFSWDSDALAKQLAAVRLKQGQLIGRMQTLGFPQQEEAVLTTLTEEVLKSSEIEGEKLDKEAVRSSLARRLGMDAGSLPSADRNVEGVVEMMLDATQKFKAELTAERLFGWQASLFPTGRSNLKKITVGAWRDASAGPMQVVSGDYGRERVHYEAPTAEKLDVEMTAFLKWYNTEEKIDPIIKAAIAHLWFVTIHPFEDGNGRIARAIADMSLARSEGIPQRFYSMSAQIRSERKTYYDMLESTQKDDLDVTLWLEWFLGCLDRAFSGAETILAAVLEKADFWKRHATAQINDRQRDMLNRLLDGFEGKLTSSKWATIEKCSPDTALRDIQGLVNQGILTRDEGGGRSTSYSLASL
ncbi:cell division protein Fic [Bradyrhizobium sp. NAS80.1]|uniref:Fic family protein n=1 Tax=Bradyrhizobium sp. NAS80.1 TaxID=1680159 RepID=UPI0009644B60|nr:Fic family protein [Bradyrhizobium sp. NAS80.1]OKO87630.1 cell division protein Fic [Bradyrhizobium sp. NAS80.1]